MVVFKPLMSLDVNWMDVGLLGSLSTRYREEKKKEKGNEI